MKALRIACKPVYTQLQTAQAVALAFTLGLCLGAGLGFILIP